MVNDASNTNNTNENVFFFVWLFGEGWKGVPRTKKGFEGLVAIQPGKYQRRRQNAIFDIKEEKPLLKNKTTIW